MADCLFMIIIKELLIEMDANQSLVPMQVGIHTFIQKLIKFLPYSVVVPLY